MKRNCLYTVNPWNTNIFACGGNKHAFGDFLKEDSNSYMGNWLGANNMSKGAGAMVGALGTAVGGLGSKLIGNGYDAAGVGNGITTIGSTIGGAVSQVNPLVGGIISAGSGIIGGTVNRLWGMKTDQEALNRANSDIASMKSFTSNANSFDNIEGPAAVASVGNVYKGGVFKKGTARRKNQAMQNDLNNAVAFANNSVANNIENLQADQFNNLLANYAAFGGYFDMPQATGALGIMRDDKYIGAINNRSNAIAKANAFSQAPTSFSPLGNAFADGGGIHIKPSHKGLFTEKANRAGMGVQAYASHVLANKEDYPSSTVKQANFAKNAAGWKHDVGGSLEAAFLDNFSSDPLGAVMQYNRGLEAMAAQREAEEAAAAQQAAYDDMQKRMLAAETERQGLKSMLDSQGLTIQALMNAQRQNNYADDWKERMGQAVDDVVANSSSIVSNAADKNKNWQYIKKRLKASGKFNDTQIEGIKLNLQRESGFNWQDRSGDNGSAWGLAQWHKPRRPKDMSFDGQINHLIDTLYNYDGTDHWIGKDNYRGFMNARTPEEAHYYIAKGWERPADSILEGLKVASDKSLKTHAFGGELGTNGTDFTNGLLEINTGGNHEENPYEGVQLGLDPQGIPNLVEEGETVYNDYVYSKRMKVPEFMKKQLGLGGSTKDEITFADASKKIAEASKERPNNPMDQEYLADALGKLAQVQEAERMRMQAEEANAEMEAIAPLIAACGGKLRGFGGNLYDDGGALAWLRKNHNDIPHIEAVAKAMDRYMKANKDSFYDYPEVSMFGNNQNSQKTWRYDRAWRNMMPVGNINHSSHMDKWANAGLTKDQIFDLFYPGEERNYIQNRERYNDYVMPSERRTTKTQAQTPVEKPTSLYGYTEEQRKAGAAAFDAAVRRAQETRDAAKTNATNATTANKKPAAAQSAVPSNSRPNSRISTQNVVNETPTIRRANVGTWKNPDENHWDVYTRPGLEAFLTDVESRANMAPDEATRNAIIDDAINQFNNLQQSYYDNILPNVGEDSYPYSDAVRNHQASFDTMRGNTGFADAEGNNIIGAAINKPQGANTQDNPTNWVDGYNGPQTALRYFGSTENGNDEYFAPIADRFRNLGVTFAPNDAWRYGYEGDDNNTYSLYQLSRAANNGAPEANAEPKPGDPNYWNHVSAPINEGWNEYSSPAAAQKAAEYQARHPEEAPVTTDTAEDTPPRYDTWMRYAPAVGAGIMTLTDALGLTNKPDYTYANKLEAAAERAGYAPNVKFNPIGDYMTYRPLDRLFYANQLQANARATDRALANTSGGNRGTAQAAMLANGYNTNNNLGNLYRQAEEYNLAQREKVADFNRRTNMFNSQMGLEADSANARYRQMASHAQLSGLAQAAAMRDSIDQRVGAARAANLTNLFTSLGNIGRENMAFNMINSTNAARNGYWIDNNGVVHYVRKKGE